MATQIAMGELNSGTKGTSLSSRARRPYLCGAARARMVQSAKSKRRVEQCL